MSALPAEAAGNFRLGDLEVRRLGFGTMRLTGSKPFHHGVPRDRATSIAALRRAVELGVNHIDTAGFYFSQLRSANELVNSALSPTDDLVIATKVGPRRDASGQWSESARPEDLRGQVEENLRQFGRDHLDVVNYRSTGRGDSITDQVGALAELSDAGLVRYIGVSGVTPARLEEARAVTEVVCVQNRHGVGSTGDPGHLEANVAAGGIRLDEGEVARLAEVSPGAAR